MTGPLPTPAPASRADAKCILSTPASSSRYYPLDLFVGLQQHIEHLLANGYVPVDGNDFDRDRAIFPETVLAFIRETQPSEWAKLGRVAGATP
jgi:hypothetical protein